MSPSDVLETVTETEPMLTTELVERIHAWSLFDALNVIGTSLAMLGVIWTVIAYVRTEFDLHEGRDWWIVVGYIILFAGLVVLITAVHVWEPTSGAAGAGDGAAGAAGGLR